MPSPSKVNNEKLRKILIRLRKRAIKKGMKLLTVNEILKQTRK